jgi:hypothetical protein
MENCKNFRITCRFVYLLLHFLLEQHYPCSVIINRLSLFYRQPCYNKCNSIQLSRTTTETLKPEIQQNTNKCKPKLPFNLTCMHWPKFNKPQHSNNLDTVKTQHIQKVRPCCWTVSCYEVNFHTGTKK